MISNKPNHNLARLIIQTHMAIVKPWHMAPSKNEQNNY